MVKKIPHSHIADQRKAPRGKATEQLQSQDTRNTIKVKHPAMSFASR